MNTLLRQAALAAMCLLAAGRASAEAHVTFVQPENFSDMPFATSERDQVLKDLHQHFDKLAAKLPAGQQLNVEVTDIDLAGRSGPSARYGGRVVRIMNGRADWPQMTLHYTITQGDQVIKSGQDELSDMSYQQHIIRYGRDDSLRYEKNMLDQWFRERIAAR